MGGRCCANPDNDLILPTLPSTTITNRCKAAIADRGVRDTREIVAYDMCKMGMAMVAYTQNNWRTPEIAVRGALVGRWSFDGTDTEP